MREHTSNPVLGMTLNSPEASLVRFDEVARAAPASRQGFIFLDGKADIDAVARMAAAADKAGMLPTCS